MADRRTVLATLAGGVAVIGSSLPLRPARADEEFFLGKADAPVEVIEYASLTCPHCATFHTTILPDFKTRYIDTGKVRLIYRDFPLDGVALKAAVVARCAGPDRYFRFVSALFDGQQGWAYAKDPILALKMTARQGGLTDAKVDACLADKALEDAVLQSRLNAQQQFKVNSTPTFVVNGKVLTGVQTVEDLAKVIDPLVN